MHQDSAILFDSARLRKRRARAAPGFAAHDFLLRRAAEHLAEAMEGIAYPFARVAELGASFLLAPLLAARPGTQHYWACDIAPVHRGTRLVLDPERLPFAPASLDAVYSAGGLHWINDLPGCLLQVRQALRPDGLFMATLPGPDTLRELRQVFAATDAALHGGITPRIAPFPDVRDAGGLLQRAGFALPVVDRDILTVSYPDLWALMADLRGSGQVNMLRWQVQHFTPRRFFADAAKRYHDMFADAEGRIAATFEIVTMTGWAPADTQQRPARRGSGQVSLTDILN